MKCQFEKLILICKQDEVHIDFSPEVNYFWGQISAGKSSIVRLIDYCLGGQLERTPAISQELLSVELKAIMADNKVSFQREAQNSNKVQVTWVNVDGDRTNLLVPITSSRRGNPIYGEDIYTLSDLILYFFGVSPFKVHISRRIGAERLATLSFRDILWYCYLKQEYLDSSFFRLERPPHMYKSRYAFMFIIGFYSEKLSELEKKLSELRNEFYNKSEEFEKIKNFLEPFGYTNVYEIDNEITDLNKRLVNIKSQLDILKSDYVIDTNFADELRVKILNIDKKIEEHELVCVDIENKLKEQDALLNELLISQDKIDRLEYAKNVLDDVPYAFCPACGKKIMNKKSDLICYLCNRKYDDEKVEISLDKEIIKRDVYNRIDELQESIQRLNESLSTQNKILKSYKIEKESVDNELDYAIKEYDSRYLNNSRILERNMAKHEEKIVNLNRIRKLPMAISKNEKHLQLLKIQENDLQKNIKYEKTILEEAKNRIMELEYKFLESLLRVEVPGINEEDIIIMNQNTWMPEVLPLRNESLKWNFLNAGSAGKKTLFNVCYALSIHYIAKEYDLNLPTFLIIDTPMKNIGEDVNREIFEAFYKYFYELAEGPLKGTQFIIIDKEYFPPDTRDVDVKSRYMTPDDDEHPPLIPYYRGP